ncbi:MAG: ECF transporter S component [Bacillota bacterium]|nr:ECF transporter S component [Bacillota bacterium]
MAVLAAATIYVGFYVFDNKQYVTVCLLLIVYAIIPFFVGFERRRPKAREIVILAVLIAVATVGRAAFFMIPNFKPVLAIVIISGVALGKESGFLVGAMSAFVSNFLFGQGPWTPWQMIAMAVVGYLAGLIFHRFSGSFNRPALVVFGAIAAFVIYGLIVDLWTILVMTPDPTLETAVMVYSAALYFNLIHAAATVIFLLLLAKPMIGKLERVKVKYGMGVFGA